MRLISNYKTINDKIKTVIVKNKRSQANILIGKLKTPFNVLLIKPTCLTTIKAKRIYRIKASKTEILAPSQTLKFTSSNT